MMMHERIHMRQRNRYGGFLFSFLYLFFPFPIFFAYYRMKFEKEAYEETMYAVVLVYDNDAAEMLRASRDHIVSHFTSATYFWMWPFKKSIERWYDASMENHLRF